MSFVDRLNRLRGRRSNSEMEMTREEALRIGLVVAARPDEELVTGDQNDQEGDSTPPTMAEALVTPGGVLAKGRMQVGRVDTTRGTRK